MDPSPLSVDEKRFVLGEIIKSSTVDLDALIFFIHHHGISPNWMHMQLPRGRNMSQCMQAAKHMSIQPGARNPLLASGQGEPASSHVGGATTSPEQDSPSVPATTTTSSVMPKQLARIAPRPANGGPALHGRDVPAASLPAGGQKPAKKRGRPSKADLAKRDLKPNLPKPIAPRPPPPTGDFQTLLPAPSRPLEAAPTASLATTEPMIPLAAEGGDVKSGKRRRIAEPSPP